MTDADLNTGVSGADLFPSLPKEKDITKKVLRKEEEEAYKALADTKTILEEILGDLKGFKKDAYDLSTFDRKEGAPSLEAQFTAREIAIRMTDDLIDRVSDKITKAEDITGEKMKGKK